jgi:hypothetical protein
VPLRAGFHLGWFSSPLELLPHERFGLVVAVVVDLVGLGPVFGGNLSARVVVAALTVIPVVLGVLSCWDV